MLRARNLGAEISVDEAYSRSELLRGVVPANRYFAHETVHHCFVILKDVNFKRCTFHLEASDWFVSSATLLQVAQDYVMEQMLPALKKEARVGASLLTVRLFEDNGRETGLEGRLRTFPQVLGEQLTTKEVPSHALTLVAAFLAFKFGFSHETPMAALIGLGVVVIFGAMNGSLKYLWSKRKIKFGFEKG